MFREVKDERQLDDSSDRVREIYGYWLIRRGGRAMPRRSDIDPVDLPRHLPGFLLVDVVVQEPDADVRYRYQYRVVGDWEVQARGHNPTGKFVDEGFHAESLDFALSTYDRARTLGVPLYMEARFLGPRNTNVHEYAIILPLSENGSDVSQIIVYSEPVAPTGR